MPGQFFCVRCRRHVSSTDWRGVCFVFKPNKPVPRIRQTKYNIIKNTKQLSLSLCSLLSFLSFVGLGVIMCCTVRSRAHAGHCLRRMVIQFPERWFVLKRYDFSLEVLFLFSFSLFPKKKRLLFFCGFLFFYFFGFI
jgi:hypothetical protein